MEMSITFSKLSGAFRITPSRNAYKSPTLLNAAILDTTKHFYLKSDFSKADFWRHR